MLNQLVMVGRLVQEPELKQISDEKKVLNVTVAVSRPFKNANGEYETDFFDCVIWNGIADATSEYCHKGDMVGIKGRLQNRKYEDNEGNIKYNNEIIVEKISFLSSANKKEE